MTLAVYTKADRETSLRLSFYERGTPSRSCQNSRASDDAKSNHKAKGFYQGIRGGGDIKQSRLLKARVNIRRTHMCKHQDAAPSTLYPYASKWIAMNMLVVQPGTIIVDRAQTELILLLETTYRLNVIPLQVRHSRTLGGGFHCVTLDLNRTKPLNTW